MADLQPLIQIVEPRLNLHSAPAEFHEYKFRCAVRLPPPVPVLERLAVGGREDSHAGVIWALHAVNTVVARRLAGGVVGDVKDVRRIVYDFEKKFTQFYWRSPAGRRKSSLSPTFLRSQSDSPIITS